MDKKDNKQELFNPDDIKKIKQVLDLIDQDNKNFSKTRKLIKERNNVLEQTKSIKKA